MLRRPTPHAYSSIRHAVTVTSPSSGYGPRFSALGMKAAEEISSKWKGTTANGGRTKNFIGGDFVESQTEKWLEVRDPVCP